MVRAFQLQVPISTEFGKIVKATVDGHMVLLDGATVYKSATELSLTSQNRSALDREIRKARKPVASFRTGDGRFQPFHL